MSAQLKCFLLVFIVLVMSSVPGMAQTPAGSDEAAIRAVVQQVQDGWNTHDAKAFSAPFAADADYVVINGMLARGRAEIEQGHAGIFSTIYKDSKNAATVKSVRFLRPDVAVVHIEWNLDYQMGGQARKGRAMNTMVMTKEAGKWSIAVFQNTSMDAPMPRT